MATQFGSADVKLRLVGENGKEYEGNPVRLHSQVVEKSEFFKTMLSKRWSGNKKPFEIEVTTVHDFEYYLKCIDLMHSSLAIGQSFSFSNVDECLAVLSIASEWLVNDCMEECMIYLEAVRWTSEEESQISYLLSSLQLKVFPDLAARLDKQDEKQYLHLVEQNMKAMMSLISQGDNKANIRVSVEKYMSSLKETGSPGVADLCGRIFVAEFNGNLQSLKSFFGSHSQGDPSGTPYSALLWLFPQIEQLGGRTFEATLKTFCEDAELARFIKSRCWRRKEVQEILVGFLKGIGNGKIIAGRGSRVSFLANWLPVMAQFSDRGYDTDKLEDLEKGFITVLETLPPADQNCIYHIWIDAYKRLSIRIMPVFTWWSKQLQSYRP